MNRQVRRVTVVWAAWLLVTGVCASARAQVEPVGQAPPAQGWKKTTVIQGLEHPWGMAFLPDGSILVTERPGRLRLVRDWKLVEEPIKGVPVVFAQGQGGLLDIALHPKFEENRWVYLTYAGGTRNANFTTVARGRLNADATALEDFKVLFEARPTKQSAQHFGSRLVWLPDGTLLVSIGDGGNPPLQVDGILAREQAQRLDRHLGKILRLNEDGSVPQDNPFVGRENARPEIYSYGHRNIQGMALDPQTGRVWANEHGPRGGDELNLIVKGANYGWPLASFGRDYRTNERITPHDALEGMESPKAVWTPSPAPSGLLVYTGDKFPNWRGDLFSGELMGQGVRRLRLEGDRVVGQESITIGRRVRDVRQGPDGLIYLLTDHSDGEMIRIEPE